MPLLQDAITLRGLVCPNRIFMAPLTRCRAEAGRFLRLEAVQAALAIALTAWLVLTLDVGWIGRVIGFLLPAAGIALLLLRECGAGRSRTTWGPSCTGRSYL